MTYKERKERARQKAIYWQNEFATKNYTWFDLSCYFEEFYNLGKRYGLLKEFKENGII